MPSQWTFCSAPTRSESWPGRLCSGAARALTGSWFLPFSGLFVKAEAPAPCRWMSAYRPAAPIRHGSGSAGVLPRRHNQEGVWGGSGEEEQGRSVPDPRERDHPGSAVSLRLVSKTQQHIRCFDQYLICWCSTKHQQIRCFVDLLFVSDSTKQIWNTLQKTTFYRRFGLVYGANIFLH